MSTSAERMRTHRGHKKGDHSACDSRRCRERQHIERDNDLRLLALATLDELNERGIDPGTYFIHDWKDSRELAGLEAVPWLDTEPDFLHRLQAKVDVDNFVFT